MKKIAVLITCHNRKDKTIKCIKKLFEAAEKSNSKITNTVFLTDDGSTDGTNQLVAESFPSVNILQGNGQLYWAGGMRNSWNEALKNNYDGYLLLNDDTMVFENLFNEIFHTDRYSKDFLLKQGIYIGSTYNEITNKFTYGGRKIKNSLKGSSEIIIPNGKIEMCDLGNANIMYVPNNVCNQLGILSTQYIHGVADYDYTLKAKSKKIPVLVMSSYVGTCKENNINKNEIFKNKSFKERYKYLFSPIGLAFTDYLQLQKKFFIYRYPVVLIKGYLKLIFPYVFAKKNVL